ncbi:MAG: alpha/beta-hydrolase family protein [Terracoccus sp.]
MSVTVSSPDAPAALPDAGSMPPPGHSWWRPTLGEPNRVFQLSFSGVGVTVAAFFFSLSLLPSLLPRDAVIQGVASGVTVLIGYGVGAGAQALWEYLGIPVVTGRARRILVFVLVALGVLSVALAVWRLVGWQNEIRSLYGMEPTSPTVWPVIVVVTVVVASLILIVSRSLRLLFRTVFRWLGRRLPRRVAAVTGTAVLLVIIWSLLTGVLVNGFFSSANATFAPNDTRVTEDMTRPTLPERSGSPQSLSSWDSLGRQGRYFVGGGPTVAELNQANGGGAKEPVRVYVGLQGADSVQGRADLLLEELKRSGAFERKVFVVATTTGTGFLDSNGVDPLEFAWNGDTAIAGVQYSYLPSWISLLADQEAVKETSQVAFATVHQYWASLPAASRPKLYLYGLSLGSFGVESILTSINIVNEPIDGALMVGPPFVNPLHQRLTTERDPGSPASLPIYEQSRTVRFVNEQGGLERTTGPFGPTRLVYLQHASDPVVFFSTSMAFSKPEWLYNGQRGPDVSERMGWFPVVTMWQTLLDLAGAGDVPMGKGHLYSATANLSSWVAVTQPPGWTPERTKQLSQILEARPYVNT